MKADSIKSHYATSASRWAGVGPYYAMFPLDFATEVVREYTKPGECVFDPFAGRATALFAAASEGRIGLGIEINPVGWVYGKAKLQTASREEVEERIIWLGKRANKYRAAAKTVPKFFRLCYSVEIRSFLLAARDLLDWRHRKVDWTVMALLLVDLHGKRENSLSNQMRQTRAMSPPYAVGWWEEHKSDPPHWDPVQFMLKKLEWRYAKGPMNSGAGRIYLGDSRLVLDRLSRNKVRRKAQLLLTSPPYSGIANYFYDQWIRLWLLGGPDSPRSTGQFNEGKFQNKERYTRMLHRVFAKSRGVMKRNAIVAVRTDSRQFTKEATIEALETAFPTKKIREEKHSIPGFTQTSLFNSELATEGETDLFMW